MKKKKRIVLGVTGSIAAYKAADIIRRLIEKGFKVSVIMTQSAEHFITPLTLSRLSNDKVYREMFEVADDAWSGSHISLADCDLLLIAPATANVIGKIAGGLADDLLTSVAMATKAKVIIAPAMNTGMYQNSFVQDNIKKLTNEGYIFVGPVKGKLACGQEGVGHIADVTDIVDAALKHCK